jgi:hypothetical protein
MTEYIAGLTTVIGYGGDTGHHPQAEKLILAKRMAKGGIVRRPSLPLKDVLSP